MNWFIESLLQIGMDLPWFWPVFVMGWGAIIIGIILEERAYRRRMEAAQ